MSLHLMILAAALLIVTGAQSQPGSLISTFGDNGHVNVDASAQNRDDESAANVLIQTDGKRIVVVDRFPYINAIRFNSDGTYDNTFGEGGFSEGVPLDLFGVNGSIAALQTGGKIVACGETEWNENTLTDFGVARWNTDGTLDGSFGTGGIVTKNFGYWETPQIMLLQPDEKILVGGETIINNVTYLAFARWNSDGTPDSSFGFQGGHVNPIFDGVSMVDMGLTPDGKIMVLGEGPGDFVLARFLSTGPIDVSFMGDGYEEYDFGGTYPPFIECMEVQTDGKLLLGGSLFNGVNSDMFVARYNAGGTIDNTFHGDGYQTTHIGGSETVLDLVVQGDFKVVAAGRVFYNELPTVFALARYESDGDLDGTFGVQGTQITSFSGYEGAAAVTVALHADGDISAAGVASNNYTGDVALATYDLQGTPDVDGYPVQRVTAFYADNGATLYRASAVQTDGKLVAAGYAWNGIDFDFLVARHNTDGSLDQSFGEGGYRLTHFPGEGTGDELASAVAIQADGKIVLTGSIFNFIVGGGLPVARYNPDGSPDSSFDSDGIALIDFDGIFEDGFSILIQPDEKIVVGGDVDNFVTDFDFSLCRLNPDGSLDEDFGDGGMVSTDFGYQDIIFGLALQPDGKIVATGNTSDPNSFAGFDFCTVRYTAAGVVDSGFGTDGRVTTDFDGGLDFAQAVALQQDGKIVVGGGAPIGSDFEFAIARYTSDGTPDSTFGSSGKQTTGLGGYAGGMDVSAGTDGRITMGGYTQGDGDSPPPLDVALVRYNADGTLDEHFGAAGKVTADFDGFELGYSISLHDTAVYVAGYRRIFRDFTLTDKWFGLVAAFSGAHPPADEQIIDIIDVLDTLGGVPAGTKNSLKSKLDGALKAIESGNTTAACGKLKAFINEVNAQLAKKKLTPSQAAELIEDAEQIMSDIGCGAPPPVAEEGPGTGDRLDAPPAAYALGQNYPNPFNPTTRIDYALPVGGHVKLTVFNLLGQVVTVLVDQVQEAGYRTAGFDAASLPGGVYLYTIRSGEYSETRKMLLVK